MLLFECFLFYNTNLFPSPSLDCCFILKKSCHLNTKLVRKSHGECITNTQAVFRIRFLNSSSLRAAIHAGDVAVVEVVVVSVCEYNVYCSKLIFLGLGGLMQCTMFLKTILS